MKDAQYLPKIDRRQHIINLKDIFAYYDVTKITGKGNLRVTYGRKDKRDLAVSIFNVYIAEFFDVFVDGGFIFNFPGTIEAKMMFNTVSKDVVAKARQAGKQKKLDPLATGFTSIETIVKLKMNTTFYDNKVILSENFQNRIYGHLNNKKNLLGKKDRFWDEFMAPIYSTFSDIDKKALDQLIKFGLRKMAFFMKKGLEIFIHNTKYDEYIYIGRQTDKIKDIALRYSLMTKQYFKKLRWHYDAQDIKNTDRYYTLTEEEYQKHLKKETHDFVILKKIQQECLVGKPWQKYVMKANINTSRFSTLINDYDSSNDELIFIKPEK